MRTLERLGISPAPWDYQPNNPQGITVADRANWTLCCLPNKADARLIAAAPILYEAVRRLLEVCDKNCEWNEWAHDVYEHGRAALAAASGEREVTK